ncbi:MAG: chorismate synthase [Muribaculaceae bacterium]|nr:chorismate synthase [Muribaculaceae bacterium]
MNTFGINLRLTTAGESHGPAMCAILDGMPAGIHADFDTLEEAMRRRAPGGKFGSPRREPDKVDILSGLYRGITTGAPIAFLIRNRDVRSEDYESISTVYRPSHADYTYQARYGHTDPRGGGRASARETSLRVAAGAIAQWALAPRGIDCAAFTMRVGSEAIPSEFVDFSQDDIWSSPVYCPHKPTSDSIEACLHSVASQGDTVGGIVGGRITGLPAGIGEPIYGKLHARLAAAMMSINAAHGFDYGMGFDGCCGLGSELNDVFDPDGHGGISLRTNHSGGIQGGISNGAPITFRVGFKPIPTLGRSQSTVARDGSIAILEPRGRHDVCALPRAVPVVQAMARLVILDSLLSPKL